jgi:hypothetical protein
VCIGESQGRKKERRKEKEKKKGLRGGEERGKKRGKRDKREKGVGDSPGHEASIRIWTGIVYDVSLA